MGGEFFRTGVAGREYTLNIWKEREDWLGLASEAGDYAKWQGAECPPSFSVSTAGPAGGSSPQPFLLGNNLQPRSFGMLMGL